MVNGEPRILQSGFSLFFKGDERRCFQLSKIKNYEVMAEQRSTVNNCIAEKMIFLNK